MESIAFNCQNFGSIHFVKRSLLRHILGEKAARLPRGNKNYLTTTLSCCGYSVKCVTCKLAALLSKKVQILKKCLRCLQINVVSCDLDLDNQTQFLANYI